VHVHPGPEVFAGLCRKATARITRLEPRALSNLMWACPTLNSNPGIEFLEVMCRQAYARGAHMNAQHLCTLMSRSRSRSRTIYFSNISQRKSQPSFTQHPSADPTEGPMWGLAVLGEAPRGELMTTVSRQAAARAALPTRSSLRATWPA
jgi:hypothetical protein